jgi:pilus assembly protein Flp/PilA
LPTHHYDVSRIDTAGTGSYRGEGRILRKEVPTAQMTSVYLAVLNFLDRDEEGQGLVEYAMILALIVVVAVVALVFLGSNLKTTLSMIGDSV